MSGYQFTPQAVTDLIGIWSFIAKDNSRVADKVEAAVFRLVIFSSIRHWQDVSEKI
jgi:plasmid stabilization system protein ParE